MTQMLRKGSSGPAVRELQGNLRTAGHGVRVDGSFGAETEKAVRAYQASRGLPVDGIVGPRTRNALLGAGTPRIGNDPFDPVDLALAERLGATGERLVERFGGACSG